MNGLTEALPQPLSAVVLVQRTIAFKHLAPGGVLLIGLGMLLVFGAYCMAIDGSFSASIGIFYAKVRCF